MSGLTTDSKLDGHPSMTNDAPASDWPRPGDVGYYVGDFDDAKDGRSLDDIRRDLIVFFVGDPRGDGLFYMEATADTGSTSGVGFQSLMAAVYKPGCNSIKRTLAESLRVNAEQAREYGLECLAKAVALERLAAESEGGNGGA
jgi:hypothetical protein